MLPVTVLTVLPIPPSTDQLMVSTSLFYPKAMDSYILEKSFRYPTITLSDGYIILFHRPPIRDRYPDVIVCSHPNTIQFSASIIVGTEHRTETVFGYCV